MQTAEARVAFIINGVVRQAMRDAGARALVLADANSQQAALVRKWCSADFTDDVAIDTLLVSAASKTELLLARRRPQADIFPLGDLYASELADFAGGCDLCADVAELAAEFGGVVALDAALRAFFDERRLPADPRLAGPLDAGRFSRRQPGIVPKLGARTLGIDLFI